MATLWQDLRYAARAIGTRPKFAAAAILTIALGIGANTAIFSVVNGVLLTPLPVSHPEGLVRPRVFSYTGHQITVSIPNFRDWRERTQSFETWGADMHRSRTLTGGDRPEVLNVRLVVGDYFEGLGVPPLLGRTILSQETWAGAEPVAVLSYRFWDQHFQRNPKALGRTLVLDGQPFAVIGVMPESFQFPSADTDLYLPMGFYSAGLCWDQRGCSQGTWAIARLKPGVTMAAAQADLDRVTTEIETEEGLQGANARLVSLKETFVGDIQAEIWVLMAAVGFVLLIASANVAALLLARGEARRQEIAIRTALGASQGRVMRQFLTESVVLAGAGGLVGVAIGYVGLRRLLPAFGDGIPSALVGHIALDLRVLAFTLVVTLLAGIAFGMAPALRAAHPDLMTELKEGGRGTVGRHRRRLRSALVMAEVALSLVLLVGAGLMIRSIAVLSDVDKGFDPANVFTARVSLPKVAYPTKEEAFRFYHRLQDRVERLPGVRTVSLANIIPLTDNSWTRGIWPEGVPTDQEHNTSVLFNMVAPEHFDALGIPILRGRGFSDADREGAALVCIIDDTMAEKFWPGEDPIGKRVTFEIEPGYNARDDNAPRIYRTVIGVTKNTRHYELETPSRVQVYIPMDQSGRSWTTMMVLVVKTARDPLALTPAVWREVGAIDKDIPIEDIQTMQEYVDAALAGKTVVGGILSLFSALALVLSAIGIFGVMSISVVQRLRDFGIRMALGARTVDILRMVTTEGLAITLPGVAIGAAAAAGLTRFMQSLLYNVNPVEPVTYIAVAGGLVAVALLAAYLPARRATRVDPVVVLKQE